MGIDVRPEDVEKLPVPDRAAFERRKHWLDSAADPRRGGKQIPPPGDWEGLIFKSGRGFGKTKSISEFLWWECWRVPKIIGHYVAPTLFDVKGTIFEGPAGLLSCIPNECLRGGTRERGYNKSSHEVYLSNGSMIRGFGAVEEAGRLRGPQCHVLGADELRQWDKPAGNLEFALANAMLGLRLPYPDGSPGRIVCGTTPAAIPYLKRLYKKPGWIVVTGTSYENIHNLTPSFRRYLQSLEGTQLGRQEVAGADIDEESDQTIFRRSWFRLWPADWKLPEFTFILESWDTAESEENYDAKKQTTDPSACVTLGLFNVAKYFEEKERKKLGIRSKYGVLILDLWSERLGFPDLLDRARRQRKLRWGSPHPGRKADLALIEQKSTGRSLRQMMAKWGAPTWPYNPGKESKTIRAHAASPYVAQHVIFLPESKRPDRKGMPRDWCEEFLEQVCGFVGEGSVEHDEFVDCLAQAIRYLADRGMIEATPDEKTIDYEEERDRQMREAEKEYAKEKRAKVGNPYS